MVHWNTPNANQAQYRLSPLSHPILTPDRYRPAEFFAIDVLYSAQVEDTPLSNPSESNQRFVHPKRK